MKKVAIVMFQNMRYAPFLSFYERILCDMGIPYDIIYLNRNPELNEISDDSHISIEWKKVPGISLKFEKLLNFMFYPSAAKKILNKKQYSFIIVLTTMPAVLLGKYLYKHNRGKYLIDIRDYT
ncbi:MAG: hypothetical protein IJ499_04630, partial [Clostridia bacterium]|nr:hypothetical protein [Clostridia bacterium]